MVRSSMVLALLIVTANASSHGAAKPTRPARRLAPKPDATTAEPATPSVATPGLMIPHEVKLRATTPVEAEANAVWSTRAALNIAALQCQFSPYLATVRNYNDFLRQHAEELDRARATMIAHFKRYDGTQAQNSFDRYTTQTYNSYSTLDAQFAFCNAAATAGRTALTFRKGDLGHHAIKLKDDMRVALIPTSSLAPLDLADITPGLLPAF